MTSSRSNAEWLQALHDHRQEQALVELRATLVRGLTFALANRLPANQLEYLVEDFVQEALIKILDNLDSFRGESQFTTWAHKIAVRVALTELRRRRWRDVSLEELVPDDFSGDFTPSILADPSPDPEGHASRASMLEIIERLIQKELTGRQRQAMLAVMIAGMPLEEVARRMGTNRNALYKLLHDARRQLQRRLSEQGLTPQEVLAEFEES